VQVLRLVPLTSCTGPHEVLHLPPHVGEVEVAAEPVQSAVDALVAVIMYRGHDLLQEGRGRRYVQAPLVGDHVVDHRPRSGARARANLVVDGHQGWIRGLGVAKACDEVEAGRRDRQEAAVVVVAAGESVGHRVQRARPVLDREVKPQELADPMVLRDRGQALVEEVFEAVVVRLDDEATAPKIRPPVPHRLDETNQLAFICGEGAVTGSDGSAEEGDRVAVLNEHRAKPMRRGVAFDDEDLGKVRHGEYRGAGDRGL